MSDPEVVQLAHPEPPYLEQLGLHSPPFLTCHEDRFLYLDNERLQLLNMLQHLTEYSNLLLMVIGERGVGKTSLMQRFIGQAKSGWQLCVINAHTMMDADRLLFAIAEGLGLPAPPHDPGSLQDALFQQLVKLRQQDRIPILLIDDAHELPLDALQAVFHLADAEAGDGSLLRTILFCEPQIETMLEDPAIQALRERVTHTLELPPLDAEHTFKYLGHRLAVAGHHGALPFSDKQLQQIYLSSGGMPEKINKTAHQMLSGSVTEDSGERARSSRLDPKHLSLAILLAIVVGVGWALQKEINRLFEATPVATAPVTSSRPDSGLPEAPPTGPILAFPIPQSASATTPSAPTAPDSLTRPATRAPETTAALSPATPTPTAIEPDRSKLKPPAKPAATTAAHARLWDHSWIARQPPHHFTLQILASHSKRNIETFTRQHGLLGMAVAFSSDRNGQPLYALIIGNYPDRRQAEQAISRLPPSLRQLKPAPKPWIRRFASIQSNLSAPAAAVTAPSPAASVRHNPSLTEHVAWLWSQDPSRYSLQLLGSYNPAGVLHFMQQYPLLGKAAYYRTRRNNRDWYVVVYGSYPDRATARAALTELPAEIRKTRPFVRQFSEIHAQLPHSGPVH